MEKKNNYFNLRGVYMLPKINSPIFDMVLPNGETLKFRAFTVREHESLLQAHLLSANDSSLFITTLKNIISSCVIDEINLDEYPLYIIDYIFIKIRSLSDSEQLTCSFKCNAIIDNPDKITQNLNINLNDIKHKIENEDEDEDEDEYEEIDDKVCGKIFTVNLDLNEVFIEFPEKFNEKAIISVNENIGIKLKSPTLKYFKNINTLNKGIFDITDEYIYSCIELIYDKEKIMIPEKDFNLHEFKEFVDDMPIQTIDKMVEFLSNQPILTLLVNVTCPQCHTQSIVKLRGLQDFLD
jgi:hypothetical protein